MDISVENLCSQLIAHKSLSGEEKEIVEYLKKVFTDIGFDEINVDRYGSIVALAKGRERGKTLLFDSHIDTVAIPDINKWRYDPFAGTIKDGKVFGRGASDMKGPLSAVIAGIAAFLEEHGRDFAGEILISGVVYEERFEGIAAREISKKYQPDYVIVCETSDLKLKYGQRGRMELCLETEGKPCHSSNPEKGINAVYHMAELIPEIRKMDLGSDEDLGKSIIELVDICSEPYPGASVVPARCRATYDVRTLPGDKAEDIVEKVEAVINKVKQRIPDLKAKTYLVTDSAHCYTGDSFRAERFFPAWKSDPESELALAILDAMEEAGLERESIVYEFCTNGSHYGGEAGLTVYGYGPSKEAICHTDNEYIKVSELRKAAEVYKNIAENLLISK